MVFLRVAKDTVWRNTIWESNRQISSVFCRSQWISGSPFPFTNTETFLKHEAGIANVYLIHLGEGNAGPLLRESETESVSSTVPQTREPQSPKTCHRFCIFMCKNLLTTGTCANTGHLYSDGVERPCKIRISPILSTFFVHQSSKLKKTINAQATVSLLVGFSLLHLVLIPSLSPNLMTF